MESIKEIRAFYPDNARRFSRYQESFWQFCVEIVSDNGQIGLGVGGGGLASIEVVAKALAPLLRGRKIDDWETIWDEMHSECSPYGQKGIAIMAISAIDLALWDLRGKLQGLPVCELIQKGSSKKRIKTYLTTNKIENHLSEGFQAFKVTAPFGPNSGEIGKTKNVEYVKRMRDMVGEDRDLMLDCWMGWNLGYTLEMIERLRPFRLKWIEEPLIPDDYDSYRQLKKRITTPLIATGEHEYTRFGFNVLNEFRAADIWQPDVTWCGGITEALRIAALAKTNDTKLILHRGGEVWGLHLSAALDLEWAEVTDQNEFPSSPALKGQPLVHEGGIQPSRSPGFGVQWA